MAAVSAELSACRRFSEILALFDSRGGDFQTANLAAALDRLARTDQARRRQSATGADKPRLAALFKRCTADIDTWRPFHVSRGAWAAARLLSRDKPSDEHARFFVALAHRAAAQMASMKPREAATTAWALSRQEAGSAFFDALERKILSDIDHFTARNVASLLQAFKKQGKREKVYEALSRRAVEARGEFTAQGLSVTMAALAKHQPNVLESLADAALLLKERCLRNYVGAVWALATAGKEHRLYARVADLAACQLRELEGRELSQLAWSLAKAGRRGVHFASIAEEAERRIRTLDAQSLDNLTWAFARARSPQDASTFLQAFAREAEFAVFPPRSLANTAWALSTMKQSHDRQALMTAITEEARSRDLATFEPRSLSSLAASLLTEEQEYDHREVVVPGAARDDEQRGERRAAGRDIPGRDRLVNREVGAARGDERVERGAAGRDIIPGLDDRLDLAGAIAAASIAKIAEFEGGELAQLAWAFAKRKNWPPALRREVARRAASLATFTPRDYSVVVWALAKTSDGDDDDALSAMMTVAAGSDAADLTNFSPRCLATTAWAFSRQNHARHNVDQSVLYERVAQAATQFEEPRHMAMLVWSFSRAGIRARGLFETVAERLLLFKLEPRHLAMVASAYAVAGSDDHSLFLHLGESATRQIREFELRTLAQVAWAFAVTRTTTPGFQTALAEQIVARLEEASPADVCRILWALARSSFSEEEHDEVFAAGEARLSNLGALPARDLANAAWAFARVSHRCSPRFLAQLDHAAHAAAKECQPEELAALLFALTKLNFRAELFFAEASARILNGNHWGQRELATFAWAFANNRASTNFVIVEEEHHKEVSALGLRVLRHLMPLAVDRVDQFDARGLASLTAAYTDALGRKHPSELKNLENNLVLAALRKAPRLQGQALARMAEAFAAFQMPLLLGDCFQKSALLLLLRSSSVEFTAEELVVLMRSLRSGPPLIKAASAFLRNKLCSLSPDHLCDLASTLAKCPEAVPEGLLQELAQAALDQIDNFTFDHLADLTDAGLHIHYEEEAAPPMILDDDDDDADDAHISIDDDAPSTPSRRRHIEPPPPLQETTPEPPLPAAPLNVLPAAAPPKVLRLLDDLLIFRPRYCHNKGADEYVTTQRSLLVDRKDDNNSIHNIIHTPLRPDDAVSKLISMLM